MSQSVFIRQIVRMSKPGGWEDVEMVDFHGPSLAGFFFGDLHGEHRVWHKFQILRTEKVTRDVDLDGHPQDEKVEEI